ncbi:hypothetical protein [uncultured Thiothrix sp.]|uniref:DUF6929 family protein n=1 Tax=uncultured Thiothrix sp. TaxID=223185 RepID=UPI002630A1D5|nr:hypothetical protein [uncultured Thiothrix sp.]HMT91718.1 hypothetical protein [Thiolinea sp.]
MQLTRLRSLDLAEPTAIGRPLFLAAASGLVSVGDYLYVIADDENHLGIFSRSQTAPGRLLRLLEGALPDEPKERKAYKPDFEALTLLPAFGTYPNGALLALGSGSKKRRRQGVLLGLAADGAINTSPLIIDLSLLYAKLSEHFADLNIEGAFVDGYLNLLQRGNQAANSQNACIRLELAQTLSTITKQQSLVPELIISIQAYPLGEVEGVPLCFTDAASLPDGSWVFSAAAEATDNSYADGDLVAAALGVINAQGKLVNLTILDNRYKIEGITAQVEGNQVHLLLVTDADDPKQAAVLLNVSLSGYPF